MNFERCPVHRVYFITEACQACLRDAVRDALAKVADAEATVARVQAVVEAAENHVLNSGRDDTYDALATAVRALGGRS